MCPCNGSKELIGSEGGLGGQPFCNPVKSGTGTLASRVPLPNRLLPQLSLIVSGVDRVFPSHAINRRRGLLILLCIVSRDKWRQPACNVPCWGVMQDGALDLEELVNTTPSID